MQRKKQKLIKINFQILFTKYQMAFHILFKVFLQVDKQLINSFVEYTDMFSLYNRNPKKYNCCAVYVQSLIYKVQHLKYKNTFNTCFSIFTQLTVTAFRLKLIYFLRIHTCWQDLSTAFDFRHHPKDERTAANASTHTYKERTPPMNQ